MRRREAFRLAAGGSAAGLLGARAAGGGRAGGAGPARPAVAEDHGRARDRHRAGGAAARRGQGHDRPGRPVRLRLRHVHAAGRPRASRGGPLPQAVPRRQARGPDRGHLAGPLRELVLAERPRPQQRDQRRRHGAVGHQGAAGRDARVPAPRRQGPRGGGLLRARERGGDPRGARQRPRASWPAASGTCASRWAFPAWPATARAGARPRSPPSTPRRCSSPRPTRGARSSSSRRPARSSATRWSCSTTSTSASPPPRPSASARTWSASASSSSRTRSRPRTSGGSASSASSARRRSPWGSSSTAPTSGSRSSPSGSSTTSASTSRRREASRRAARSRRSASCSA